MLDRRPSLSPLFSARSPADSAHRPRRGSSNESSEEEEGFGDGLNDRHGVRKWAVRSVSSGRLNVHQGLWRCSRQLESEIG